MIQGKEVFRMGMTIRTNTGGNTSCRNLKKTSKKGDKNLEKLASGYQINRAGDDASGMAISETMRAQIKALTTVVEGCEDGVSLVKTADGYLAEMQDMVVRMTELAGKSANGILDDETDRAALQEEMNHLGAEIDRIAETANFNGNKLFVSDVIMHDVKKTIQVNTPIKYSEYLQNCSPLPDDKALSIGKDSTMLYLSEQVGKYIMNNGVKPNVDACLEGKAIYYTEGPKCYITSKDALADEITRELGEPYMKAEFGYNCDFRISPRPAFISTDNALGSQTAENIKNAINTYKAENHDLKGLKNSKVYYTRDGSGAPNAIVLPFDSSDEFIKSKLQGKDYYSATIQTTPTQYMIPKDTEITVQEPINNEIVLQVGETSQKSDKLGVNIYDMHTDKLFKPMEQITSTVVERTSSPTSFWGVSGSSSSNATSSTSAGASTTTTIKYTSTSLNEITGNIETSGYENAVTFDISTQDNAIKNLDSIRSASEFISLVRADYGAKENRLDYTINNLNTTAENMSAAKSRIKDTDMAKEIMEYTQNNVLTQSAQSMLAQANTQPQNVLQLLQ